MGSEGLVKGLPQKTGGFSWIRDPLKEIQAGSLKFLLQARDTLVLPTYNCSPLRGDFGYAFKRVVCALRNQDCPTCLLKEKCLYAYVFETPSPSDTRVRRNIDRFPPDFMFQLTPEEKME